jgi:DnaJ-class molecular chaperone
MVKSQIMKQSAYEILNIPPQSGYKTIRSAYKLLMREFPPEKNPEKFSEIREAFEYLTQLETENIPDQFPIYINFVREMKEGQEGKSGANIPVEESLKILTQVFETPYNTLFDLTTLFENDKGTT